MSYPGFPNRAGMPVIENNAILDAELQAAGIIPIYEQVSRELTSVKNGQRDKFTLESWAKSTLANFVIEGSGEVKTHIIGFLHGWEFKRNWYYWVAKGPGIPPEYASQLHQLHGAYVRVDGHASGPDPIEYCKGFAVGSYHIDKPVGLHAFATMLNQIVEDNLKFREARAFKRQIANLRPRQTGR